MADVTHIRSTLEQIVLDLNPAEHSVAIAHLRDALAAIDAVEGGDPTKYALHDALVQGETVGNVTRRLFR
ncbi:hypothetical protein [uncultured Tateyamaria sp.]|uniref:hypothetical protein n=1 Tax=Tateyamaria sp. 1078 TaxID=3417464 RepID=UPI002621F96A|nr:hypothetical protein [uncultured Tateyamaria sp.]